MPATIADREAASSVRTKLNDLIEGFNAGVTGAPGSISALTYGWDPENGTAAENATALTAAITAAAGNEVLIPSSSNFLLDPIEITQTTDVFLRFVGPGKWDQSTGETGTLGFVNAWADIQAITAFSEVSLTLNSASTTATRISVADASGYALGDVVKVVSQDVDPLAADSAERYRGEFATVVATAAGFIYTNLLKDTYTTTPRIGRMPQRTVHIRGLRGIGNLASGRAMVSLQASYKPYIELEQQNHGRIVVNSVGSYYGTFIAKASGTTQQGTDDLGYLINDVSGEGNKCYLDGKHFRHVYTSNHNGADAGDIRLERYGRTRKPWVTGVSENSWGAPWDTHPGCEDVVFENCISLGGMTGFDNVSAFQLRGLNGTIVNGIDDGSFDSFLRLGGGFGGGTIRVINPQSSSAVILDGTIDNASRPTVIWSGGLCTVENRQEMMLIDAMDLHVTGGAVFENLEITREFSCVFNLNGASLRTDSSVVVKMEGAAVGPGTEARITRFETGTSDWFGAIQLERESGLSWRSIADQDAGTVKAAVEVDITSGGYVTPTQGTFALNSVRVKTRANETGRGPARLTPELFGAVGDGETDDTTAIGLFIDALEADPLLVGWGGSNKYLISDDFIVASPIQLQNIDIIQGADGKGFLQLRADGNRISDVTVTLASGTTRTNVSGFYRGYSADQRACALWIESGGNVIRNIRSEGIFNTICLRGPVEPDTGGVGYTGADTDPKTAFTYLTYADDNYVRDVYGKTQEFCVTGHQQRRLDLSGYHLYDTTEISGEPPHAIYMRQGEVPCIDCKISNGINTLNPNGVAHKFADFEDSDFSDLAAFDTAGGSNFIDCTNITVRGLSAHRQFKNTGTNTLIFAHFADGTTGTFSDISLENETDSFMGLFVARNGADVDIFGAKAQTLFPASGAVAPAIVRAEDTSILRIRGIDYDCAGSDRSDLFVTTGTATITASDVSQRGSALLANGAGGNIHLAIDPLKIENFDSTTMLDGTTTASFLGAQSTEFEHGASFAMYGSSTAGTQTYDIKRCYVERIGGRVTLSVKIDLGGAFNGTGDIRLGPLPYAVSSTTTLNEHAVIIARADNITVASGAFLVAAITEGDTYLRLQTLNGITRAAVAHTALSATSILEFQISYYTDAGF